MRYAVLGPTASGKSGLAVELARRLGGTVVNGDPFQALAGLPIGTGQPSEAERQDLPHRGYGERPLSTRLNPLDFGAWVRERLEGCDAPVLVTGSGLYLKGIWGQLEELPPVPESLVQRVRAWQGPLGAPRLHRYLRAVDPERAAALHPNDSARVQRALALHLATGRRPSALLGGLGAGLPEGWKGLLVLPEREAQRRRVALRVRAMAQAGWRAEVEALLAAGGEADLRRVRPLGYLDWLSGEDEAAILERITQETQAYAKRQGTWFRNQWPELPRWDPDREPLERAWELLGV